MRVHSIYYLKGQRRVTKKLSEQKSFRSAGTLGRASASVMSVENSFHLQPGQQTFKILLTGDWGLCSEGVESHLAFVCMVLPCSECRMGRSHLADR